MSHDPAAISADQESHTGHHKLLNTIGQGSFANMRLGQHILTGVNVRVINQRGSSGLQRLPLQAGPLHEGLESPEYSHVIQGDWPQGNIIPC